MRRFVILLLMLPVLFSAAYAYAQKTAVCTGAMPFCRAFGRTILTYDDAVGLRDRGYSWDNIYSASLIAAQTGERVQDLLRYTHVGGRTWPQIAAERGLEWREIRDNAYDFGPLCMQVPATDESGGG